MQNNKFNVLLDSSFGSSGKGAASTRLVDLFGVKYVSSSNFPNAGHSSVFEDGMKFVAKAIPTAAILNNRGSSIQCFISPGSGFNWPQLIKEWKECGKPHIYIHDRASVVNESHAKREREGSESTKHIASTMQGTAAAMVDKILRKADVVLARTEPLTKVIVDNIDKFSSTEESIEFISKVKVVEAFDFRNMTHETLKSNTWLHEGSQGYALSIDHGYQYPNCTSRNATVQAQMDHMGIPPSLVGDVYLNLRSFPIRVGNVVEDGVQKGYSGDWYPDSQELTWEEVAARSGMPEDEAKILAERERTTVTRRIRRVSTFSFINLLDAIRVNGATKLIMNFIQYVNWKDNKLRGGKEAFNKLSMESRSFIEEIENRSGLPVVMIGTGANHDDMINLL